MAEYLFLTSMEWIDNHLLSLLQLYPGYRDKKRLIAQNKVNNFIESDKK